MKHARSWSERSQRSFLRQCKIEEEITRIELSAGGARAVISGLEEVKAGIELRIIHGRPFADEGLDSTLRRIDRERNKLAIYERRLDELKSEIEAERVVTAQQKAERAATQDELVRLAEERLQKDELIEKALDGVRALLEHRAELTAKMIEAGDAIELSVDWDEQRYSGLHMPQPGSSLRESREWLKRLIGDRSGAKPYIVADERVILPETLAHSGCYVKGDTIYLDVDEARELARQGKVSDTADLPKRLVEPDGAFL